MYTAGQFVKVTGNPGVNERSSPSAADDANIIQGIPNGAVVPVVGSSSNGFAKVNYLSIDGWVSENFLAPANAADVQAQTTIQATSYRITGTGVNIRSGPSTNEGILTTTGPAGEIFTANGTAQNGYAQGSYTDAHGEQFRGWIAMQYLGFGQAAPDPLAARQLPQLPQAQPPPVQKVSTQQPPGAHPPSSAIMVGGLLALVLVIYFMAK